MITVASSTNLTPTRRVWLRFSLRTFLLFVAIVSILLAWFVSQARTQRMAVDVIQSVGGTIHFDYHENGPRSWSTAGIPRGPRWLRDWLGSEYFDRPVCLSLFNTPKSGEWITAFNDLPSIKTLLLSGQHVDDEILAHLRPSSALVELHLSNSSISDDGLKHLAKFPNLQWVILNNTRITDAGVVHLLALRGLQELNLNKTRISDDSVSILIGLPELQQIDLRGTTVTDEGLARIREDAPRVKLRK